MRNRKSNAGSVNNEMINQNGGVTHALLRSTKSLLCPSACLYACSSVCLRVFHCVSLHSIYVLYRPYSQCTQHNIPSIFTEFQSQHKNTFHHHTSTVPPSYTSAVIHQYTGPSSCCRRRCPTLLLRLSRVQSVSSPPPRSRGRHGRFTTVGRCLIRRFASPLRATELGRRQGRTTDNVDGSEMVRKSIRVPS